MCTVLLCEMILSWEREWKTGHGHIKFPYLICTSADQREKRCFRFPLRSMRCMMWNDHERVLNQQTLTWALSSPNFSYLCVRSPDLPMVHDKPFFFFFGAYKVWHSVFLERSTGACPVVWRCKVLLIYWHELRLIAQVLWRFCLHCMAACQVCHNSSVFWKRCGVEGKCGRRKALPETRLLLDCPSFLVGWPSPADSIEVLRCGLLTLIRMSLTVLGGVLEVFIPLLKGNFHEDSRDTKTLTGF